MPPLQHTNSTRHAKDTKDSKTPVRHALYSVPRCLHNQEEKLQSTVSRLTVLPTSIVSWYTYDFSISRNWPASYNFSLFSKLPTNYPKISEKKTYINISRSGIFRCVNRIFLENFGQFVVNFESSEKL